MFFGYELSMPATTFPYFYFMVTNNLLHNAPFKIK